MPDDEEPAPPPPRFDELARRLADHDRDAVDRSPEELRVQWNVPEGRMPHIPLWLSLMFFGSLAFMAVMSLLVR